MQKKLSVPAGAVVVTCTTCKLKLLLKKDLIEDNVFLQLEDAEENQQTVAIFKSILVELFGEQFLSEALNDSDILLERLLSSEEHDFIIARNYSVVIKVRKHNEQSMRLGRTMIKLESKHMYQGSSFVQDLKGYVNRLRLVRLEWTTTSSTGK